MESGLMSTLTGNLIANTYKQLLQVGSGNDGLTSTEQYVQDGSGENSALKRLQLMHQLLMLLLILQV